MKLIRQKVRNHEVISHVFVWCSPSDNDLIGKYIKITLTLTVRGSTLVDRI